MGATASPAAASRVWGITEWSLQETQELSEVTALGDASKTFVVGVKGATLSLKGFWLSDFDVPFDAFDTGSKVTCYLYTSADNLGQFLWAVIWPTSVGINAPASGPVGIDCAATVDGDVTRVG